MKRCSKVYIEAYTSILTVPRERLEALFGKSIEEAPRELCESAIEPILERAKTEDVAMLVVGDPGLGKSQMLRAAAAVHPRGVYVCGNTATGTGLTVTLVRDPQTGEHALEAGALVLADPER